MTDSEKAGDEAMNNPVTQRECDSRFDVVKQISEDVRTLSESIRRDVSDIKLDLSGLRVDMSGMRTSQNNHIKNHETSGRNRLSWFAMIISLLAVAAVVVFGILNNT